jgi:site-specific recombinase XerD
MLEDYNRLPEVAKDFIKELKTSEKKSNNTAKNYTIDLNQFFEFIKREKNINKIKIEDIKVTTLSDLNNFIGTLKNKTGDEEASPRTVARKKATLKMFFAYLFENKITDYNVASGLKKTKIPKREVKALKLPDAKLLIKTASEHRSKYYAIRNVAILNIFLNCALRLEELANLKVKDVDLEERVLKVIGKGNKERYTGLNEETVETIKDYLKVRKGSTNYLFTQTDGERMERVAVQTMVKTTLIKAGFHDAHTHTLRHTGATLMFLNGVDLRTLQEILGHENIATTSIYTHVDMEQKKKAANATPSFK